MKTDELPNGMQEYLEKIMANIDIKHSLKSLRKFKDLLIEAGFSESESKEYTIMIMIYLFTTHYNVKLPEQKQ